MKFLLMLPLVGLLATSAHPQSTYRIGTVKLHGVVGGLNDDGKVEGTFDAEGLEEIFKRAVANHIEMVILDVESPGGYVVEKDAICKKIVEYHDRLRIVAFVGDGLSAAAIISMTCKEIVAKPICRIGAALTITIDGEALDDKTGEEAYYAKVASAFSASDRAYMQAAGRPVEIVEAMTLRTKELWWSPLKKNVSARDGESIFSEGPNTTTLEKLKRYYAASRANLGAGGAPRRFVAWTPKRF